MQEKSTIPNYVEKPTSDEWALHCTRQSATGSKQLHLFSYRSKTKPYGVIHWGGEAYKIVKAEPAKG